MFMAVLSAAKGQAKVEDWDVAHHGKVEARSVPQLHSSGIGRESIQIPGRSPVPGRLDPSGPSQERARLAGAGSTSHHQLCHWPGRACKYRP